MKTVAALPRVLGISLLVAGATYGCTFLMKRTYQSDEVLYFPQAQGSGGSILDSLKNGGVDVDSGSVRLMNGMLLSPYVGAGPQTASGIITSHTAIRNCVDELGLDRSWGLSKNEAYDQLDKWTDAKVDKNGMLAITATAQSPQESVDILKNLEKYLNTRSDELTVNVSRSNREYLEKRVESAGLEVNRIQNALVVTMKSSPMADMDDLMKSYFSAREDLQKAQVAEAAGESRIAILEADSKKLVSGSDAFPNNLLTMSAVNTDTKALSDEIQNRQLALQDAMANFTKDSPEYKAAVRNAKNAEDVTKTIVKASRNAVAEGLTPALIEARSDLTALKSSTQRSEAILADFEKNAMQAPGQYAEVSRKKLEFDEAMKAYGMLRQQLEIARLAESRDPSRFAVLDEPYPNPKPIGPRRGLISAVAFVLVGLLQLALNSLKEDASEDDGHPRLNGHRGRLEVPAEEALPKETPRKTPV
jgi:uncharacterized protein involved in exopolysaccharide biosynthesis